jgi:hypothetical protein
MQRFDAKASLDTARQRYPIERVMEGFGHAPRNGNWKSFSCPHCGAKKKSGGLCKVGGVQLFKCFHQPCPSGNTALDEVGYVALVRGLSRKDAFREYLRMAGVWQELPAPSSRPATPTSAAVPDSSQAPSSNPPQVNNASPDGEPPPLRDGEALPSSDAVPWEVSANAAPEPSELIPPAGPEDAALVEIGVEASNEDLFREFHAALSLTPEHERALLEKRGLGSDAAEQFGFKSSVPCNERILQEMAQRHPMEALVRSGLWKRKDGRCRPQPQWCGWGLTGRDAEGNEIWSGTANPVIIPYLNEDGKVAHLRPHKGGIPGLGAKLYVPRRMGAPDKEKHECAVVTEGEFKAAILRYCLEGRWAVAAVPGIQMGQNYNLRQELYEWLRGTGAKTVVVCFDNEDKGNPALAGYKEDPEKRQDSVIWARVLAEMIARDLRVSARVGMIPANARDAKGKADFDGLASQRLTPADLGK